MDVSHKIFMSIHNQGHESNTKGVTSSSSLSLIM